MATGLEQLKPQARDLRDGVLVPDTPQFVRFAEAMRANGTLPNDLQMEIGSSLGVSDLKIEKMYATWNDLTLDLALTIQMARSDVFVASRYFDFRISEASLRAVKRGCRFKTLHSSRVGSPTRAQVLGNLAANPKASRIFKQVLNDPNVTVKEAEFPFSFVVLDYHLIGTEIVNPKDPDYFFLGLKLESPQLASKFVSYFNDLAEKGSEDNRREILSSQKDSLK